MMQRVLRGAGSISRQVIASLVIVALAGPAAATDATIVADRTTCLLPLPADAPAGNNVSGRLPDQWLAAEASSSVVANQWRAYQQLWRAHHGDPADHAIRRFLDLPSREATEIRSRRGRRAPPWLGWRGGYQQVDTPHFQLLSRADAEMTRRVAQDLERVYWVWTQLFFPLWKQRERVGAMLDPMGDDESVKAFLARHSYRLPVQQKLRVVLFRDAGRYRATLRREVPGIAQSTGYYSDRRRTTFLYAANPDDSATRWHELAHQLFREASDSSLGRRMPGETAGFWLVEGIAGYFESLVFRDRMATIGGWDAPRLQYARYRILATGDSMPIRELRRDGRRTAQQRADLARWYAHAIAHTHRLFDSGAGRPRRWAYQQLAELYAVDSAIPPMGSGGSDSSSGADDSAAVLEGAQRALGDFLSIDDAHLRAHPIDRSLQQLCLRGCEVTGDGLATISESEALRWLDLSRLPIGAEQVSRLAARPRSLVQLSLEATQVDSHFAPWLRQATRLQEIDLSSTRVDDSVVDALSGADDLETLWLTGTDVSDASIDSLIAMRRLEAIDLQQTAVTEAGIQRLRRARPQLKLNPLELRSR